MLCYAEIYVLGGLNGACLVSGTFFQWAQHHPKEHQFSQIKAFKLVRMGSLRSRGFQNYQNHMVLPSTADSEAKLDTLTQTHLIGHSSSSEGN